MQNAHRLCPERFRDISFFRHSGLTGIFLDSCFLGKEMMKCIAGIASISTVLEMTNGTADLGEADDKLLVAEPRHGCWGVGKF